jgi:2-oxoglutarate dehydrogenase E2 component (dihydrolipoamide succinyltransferase)
MTKVEVQVPSVGESVTEVTVGKILVDQGTFVQEDTMIIELESDKASLEVPAPVSGTITFSKKIGEVLSIGEVFAVIDSESKPSEPIKSTPKQEPLTPSEPKQEPLTPLEGVREQIDAHIQNTITTAPMQQVSVQKPQAREEFAPATTSESTTRIKMPKIRSIIARRLVGVKNETAMLTTFNEVDMSAVMAIRTREKDAFAKKYGVNLTFLPFFMKAASQALTEFAEVNAYIEGDEIVYNKNVHMGIAVSTEKGLVVPVIRNINTMSMVEMTRAMNKMAEVAKNGKLTISDMAGGTFTITNGGVFGSMLSTPILNPPQSAILGLHNIVDRPVAVDGKVEIRPIMYLALSYDHRIIDGKDSVQFLVRIKKLIEDPALYILGE